MKSKVVYTEEIDFLDDAMDELAEQLEGFEFKKNTCGIVCYDPDAEIEGLMAELQKKFPFPCIGTSTVASISKNFGFQRTGITMLVLTDDECEFGMSIAKVAGNREGVKEHIEKAYNVARSQLKEKEKLIIAFAGIMKDKDGDLTDECGDEWVDCLDEVTNGTPVFGGLSSDVLTFDNSSLFVKDKFVTKGIGILAISGPINPIFHMDFSFELLPEYDKVITSAKNSHVYEVDHEHFSNILESIGIEIKSGDMADITMGFIGIPFIEIEKAKTGEEVMKVRTLCGIGPKDNLYGIFFGRMTEGSRLKIGLMKKDNVKKSVKKAFETLLEELEKSGHEYSTIVCVSCASRFLLLAPEQHLEADAFKGLLPDNIDLMGFYSYGEMAPIRLESGHVENVFYNDTFTILAL